MLMSRRPAAARRSLSSTVTVDSVGTESDESRSPHSSINFKLKEPCGAAAQAAEKLFPTVPPRCRLRIIPLAHKGELYLCCQWQSTLELVRSHESEPSRGQAEAAQWQRARGRAQSRSESARAEP
jgi:hypothetical protein